jgi:hypothetical protein
MTRGKKPPQSPAPQSYKDLISEVVKEQHRDDIELFVWGEQLVYSGFTVSVPEQAEQIIAEMAKEFEVADYGWAKTPTGYFDRRLCIRLPNGMLGEVQIWPTGMIEAKREYVFAVFKQWRELPPGSQRKGDLFDRTTAIYKAVAEKLSPEWGNVLKEMWVSERQETSS